jgi:lipopolysaccharide export system protein LptA
MGRRTARRKLLCLFCVGFGLIWSVAIAEEQSAGGGKQGKKSSDSSFADSFSLTSRHEPIHIRSHDLEFLYEEKRIIYRGEVVAVQGDATLKSDLLTVIYEDAPPETAVTPVKENAGNVQETAEKTGVPVAPDSPSPVKEVVAKDNKNVETNDAPPTTEGAGGKKGKAKNQGKKAPGQGEGPSTAKQRIKEIIAEGNVDITSSDRHATSKKAVFNETLRTVVLTGDAHVQQLGNWVTGERVTVYLDENRSVVEGGGGDRRAEMEIVNQQGTEKVGTETSETGKVGTEKSGARKKGVKKP